MRNFCMRLRILSFSQDDLFFLFLLAHSGIVESRI